MVRCSIRDIIVNWYSLAGAIYYTIAIWSHYGATFSFCFSQWRLSTAYCACDEVNPS